MVWKSNKIIKHRVFDNFSSQASLVPFPNLACPLVPRMAGGRKWRPAATQILVVGRVWQSIKRANVFRRALRRATARAEQKLSKFYVCSPKNISERFLSWTETNLLENSNASFLSLAVVTIVTDIPNTSLISSSVVSGKQCARECQWLDCPYHQHWFQYNPWSRAFGASQYWKLIQKFIHPWPPQSYRHPNNITLTQFKSRDRLFSPAKRPFDQWS